MLPSVFHTFRPVEVFHLAVVFRPEEFPVPAFEEEPVFPASVDLVPEVCPASAEHPVEVSDPASADCPALSSEVDPVAVPAHSAVSSEAVPEERLLVCPD